MLNGNKIKFCGVLLVVSLLAMFVATLAFIKLSYKVNTEDNNDQRPVTLFGKGDSLYIPRLLSIEEVEHQFNVEILLPMKRELHDWCLRHTVNVPSKTNWTTLSNSMNDIRSLQEASRSYYVFKLGEPNEKGVQRMFTRIQELSERNLK